MTNIWVLEPQWPLLPIKERDVKRDPSSETAFLMEMDADFFRRSAVLREWRARLGMQARKDMVVGDQVEGFFVFPAKASSD